MFFLIITTSDTFQSLWNFNSVSFWTIMERALHEGRSVRNFLEDSRSFNHYTINRYVYFIEWTCVKRETSLPDNLWLGGSKYADYSEAYKRRISLVFTTCSLNIYRISTFSLQDITTPIFNPRWAFFESLTCFSWNDALNFKNVGEDKACQINMFPWKYEFRWNAHRNCDDRIRPMFPPTS